MKKEKEVPRIYVSLFVPGITHLIKMINFLFHNI